MPSDSTPGLEVLIERAIAFGADRRLVQGAGGNLSVKSDGVMWIKASGTRFGEAGDAASFVPMREAETREAVLVTEALTEFIVAELAPPGLRPSIETALHVLLPHRYVFHLHGIGSIAAGLDRSLHERVSQLPGWFDTVVVPYAKPGIELARAVVAATAGRLDRERPLALVLVNHGLVVGHEDAAEAARMVDIIEQCFRIAPEPVREQAANGPVDAAVPDGVERLFPPGTVAETAGRVLMSGALTPDSAVFLGARPFSPASEIAGGGSSCWIGEDGAVLVSSGLGPDEREIAVSLVDAATQVSDPAEGVCLAQADIAALLNWEAEHWRQQLKR